MKGLTKRLFKVFFSFLVLAGLFVGCATQQKDPCQSFMTDPPAQSGYQMNSVKILDRSLESESVWVTYCQGQRVGPPPDSPPQIVRRYKISTQTHTMKTSPSGIKEVMAVFQNHTEYPLQIEGRTQFLDENTIPTKDITEWQRIHLPPKSIGTYRASSKKTEGIAGYYIEVREGR